jgi:hypothetical protein
MVTLLTETTSPETVSALTTEEKIRLHQLERVVEKNLSAFIECGRALCEIKSSKLFLANFPTWEAYVRERWGLARSRADELIRSTSCAEMLIANGAGIPAGTSEAVVRPVSNLPSPELQVQAWRVIQAVSPERGPTQPIASKVCRQLKNAIEAPGEHTGHKTRGREHSPRELAFISPVRRLSAYKGFDANLVVSHVDKFSSALSAFTACRIMADRCLSCCRVLADRFPELTDG